MSHYRFIVAEKAAHSVVRLCRVLGVARSAFYAWQHQPLSAHAQTDAHLLEHIRAEHAASNGTYGAPRVHARLRRQTPVARKRVARLMRAAGLHGRARARRVRTTWPDRQVATTDLVQRQFRPPSINQLWVADVTYVRTLQGWLYLAVVLDACSRRVVGWAMHDQQRSELVCAALRMALLSRRPPAGLIHHSDRGAQYLATAYRELLVQHGARPSVGQPGTAWDNAVAESFFATLKRELVHPTIWPTRQAARSAIVHYIEAWYNRLRLHSTLEYRSPLEYETAASSLTTTTAA